MNTGIFVTTRTETIHLNGEGERVSLHNLISEMSFEVDLDMDRTDNRNKLWDCVDRLAPEDRELINQVYFTDDVRRGDDEIARLLGVDDAPEFSRRRRAILNALERAMLR